MYRPSARAPRGPWARYLHAQRRERDWSQTQAFEHVREGLGLSPKSRAVYAALDMGDRQPRDEEATYLATVFGWPPDLDPDSPVTTEPETQDPMAAAIRDLTGELAAMRQERVVWGQMEVRLRAVEAELALRAPGGDAGSQVPSVPPGTEG